MNLKDLMAMLNTAKKIGYSVKLELAGSQKSMILNPFIKDISSRTIDNKDYVVLKRSLLDVDEIESAYFYRGDSNE